MNFDDTFCTVEFKNSQEKKEVSLSILGHDVIDFLEHYGEESLVGKPFYGIIGEGDGETKFLRLLKATGCENDPRGFFAELTEKLGHANSNNGGASESTTSPSRNFFLSLSWKR